MSRPFLSIERVLRGITIVSVVASSFGSSSGITFLAVLYDFVEAFTSCFTRFGSGFFGLGLLFLRFKAFGFNIDLAQSSFDSSVKPTREKADCRLGVIGMTGDSLGHGELMYGSVDDTVERIDGILNKTGFVFEGVLGSRIIGLKKIISVFKESGEEQALGVSDDELSLLISDSAGLEPVEAEVEGVFDLELLVIFEKKVIPLLKADLKILLYLLDEDVSLTFDNEPVDTASLKPTKINSF